ncbi:MAG: EAL domain-containing protein [Dehalococcoidia bacterium]|nr:EAL domain-containing protein [Dehalococcoidia bacterium]
MDAGHLHQDQWAEALQRVLADPTQPHIVFQPIVDLKRGVSAGYEALARFTVEPAASPDRWFVAAQQHGCAAELETRTLRNALSEAALGLPRNTFLTVNISPETLTSAAFRGLCDDVPRLHGVVFELTEHAPVRDYDTLRAAIREATDRGAMIAVDDAGAGYSSLSHILELRPAFVKLDRVFVDGCDRDPAKAALIGMLGRFVGELDAWIIAEGVEHAGELDTLVHLGVPLAQGYYMARPRHEWAQPGEESVQRIRQLAEARSAAASALSLAEPLPPCSSTGPAQDHPGMVAVAADALGMPESLFTRTGESAPWRQSGSMLKVNKATAYDAALRRALQRPPESRFDPLVITDDHGRYAGICRFERLAEAMLP